MEDLKLAGELMETIRKALASAVKDVLSRSYNNPFEKLLSSIIDTQAPALRELLLTSLTSALADGAFRTEIAAAVRSHLAKVLIQRFGGELEKRVNQLKSDPATRARFTLLIDQAVESLVKV